MAYQQLRVISKHLGSQIFTTSTTCTNIKRFISTSYINCLDQRWRIQRGLPKNPNAHGVLTDSPDYSFLDGRPTPYGVKQRIRMQKQKEIAEQIISLTAEVDFAVERHKQLQIEEEQRRKEIIDNKLKPKGLLLLTQKK